MVNFETGIDQRSYQLFRGKDLYERQKPKSFPIGATSLNHFIQSPMHAVLDTNMPPGVRQPVHLGNCCIPVFEQMQDAHSKHGVETLIRRIEIVKARLIERNICGPAGVRLASRDFDHSSMICRWREYASRGEHG